MARRQISPERKMTYYAGIGLMILGFLLFISNFFIDPFGGGSPFGGGDPFLSGPRSMAGRAIGGMVLIIIGGVLTNIGAKGAAGSGLILDPEQAREDLEPWARTAGGLVRDALDEVKAQGDETPKAPAEPVIKVRCPQCKVLNDEDARFCKGCGTAL